MTNKEFINELICGALTMACIAVTIPAFILIVEALK